MKYIRAFYLKIFSFLSVKFSICLNRRVFVMVLFVVLLLCSVVEITLLGKRKLAALLVFGLGLCAVSQFVCSSSWWRWWA